MTDEILLIGFVLFFIVQAVILVRIVFIIRRFTKILFEIRLMFKHAGLSYDQNKNLVIKEDICEHCQYRMPYIEMSDEASLDNFYYKCKKRNVEIDLSDTCKFFKRDYQLK
jgi:hypothetical protein